MVQAATTAYSRRI